jgi:hypothetical protein
VINDGGYSPQTISERIPGRYSLGLKILVIEIQLFFVHDLWNRVQVGRHHHRYYDLVGKLDLRERSLRRTHKRDNPM